MMVGVQHLRPRSTTHSTVGLVAVVAAIGVVFGDIGTSPLYAIRVALGTDASTAVDTESVLGVLSLVFWSLVIVIGVKYLLYVLRADNDGEGGILALTALAGGDSTTRRVAFLVALGVFGSALLYGDGMITPAISVLSAIEGVEVAVPGFQSFVVPATVVVLILLFRVQHHGTARIGRVFGPIMILWFAVIAGAGVVGIVRQPSVLAAVSPSHAVGFVVTNRGSALVTIGAIFLVVTGGEALYADLGHFGTAPIRRGWYTVVFPALLLSYFGQGALLLHDPTVNNPFFGLVPRWGLYPLVALATAATVIASQAVISGAFSLSRQAMRLGYLPRIRIDHTSSDEAGQVYVPAVNNALMVATVLLVIAFRKSENLAGAYGVAVATTMMITTVLAHRVARIKWGWPRVAATAATAVFLCIDTVFLAANFLKIPAGGWVPLAVAGAVFGAMTTWRTGRSRLGLRIRGHAAPLHMFVESLADPDLRRFPGTGVVMTGLRASTPPPLAHLVERVGALPERVIVATVDTASVPHVRAPDRATVVDLDRGISRVMLHYGFMDRVDVPADLERIKERLDVADIDDATYYVGHITVVPGRRPGMAAWRQHLYAIMDRNEAAPIGVFRLPRERVIEIGMQVDV